MNARQPQADEAPERPELRDDRVFDSAYPRWVRRMSRKYWTPVEVARKAASLLVENSGGRVLDVGSGSGKFCIVGTLATGAEFYGVERDRRLVNVARRASRHYGAHTAQFVNTDAKDLDWSAFDGFYFFNPFGAGCTSASERQRRQSERRQREDVAFTTAMLQARPHGTRVVTYHGFGDQMPLAYRRRRTVFFGLDRLELWLKE